jgi:hypothetical protein
MHKHENDAVFDQIFRAAVAGLPAPQASPDFDDRIIDAVVTQSTWRADALIGMRRFAFAASMALAVFFPLTYALAPAGPSINAPVVPVAKSVAAPENVGGSVNRRPISAPVFQLTPPATQKGATR